MQVHNYNHPPRTSSGYTTSSYTSSTSRPTSISSIGSTPTLTTSRTSTATAGAARPRTRHYSFPDEPSIEEGFFSSPSSFRRSMSSAMCEPTMTTALPSKPTKPKIKPLWKIATGNARGSGNSLDLSQPGGGEAAKTLGLGIYGYDELDAARSGRVVVPAAAPTTAVSAVGYGRSAAHPRRQVPRPYTPSQSYTTANSEHDSSSDDESEMPVRTSRGYYSGEYSRGNSIDVSRLPPLRTRTDSSTMVSPAMRSSSSFAPSPILISSTTAPCSRPGRRKTKSSSSSSATREPSPSFVASVTAARAAWDAKEAEKEEKRERKRRKSEQRERERRASRDVARGSREWDEKEEYTSSSYENQHLGSVVDIELPVEEVSEPEDDMSPRTSVGARPSMMATPAMRPGSGSTVGGSRRTGKGVTLKKKWLGFVVWLRIGFVKMGRKLGGSGDAKSSSKKR